MKPIRAILKSLFDSLRDLLPIMLVIGFFQLLVLQQAIPDFGSIALGVIFVVIGLTLFVYGLNLGLFPIGESMAFAFASKGSVFWLLAFAFALGFGTTIAEPALIAVANEAAKVAAAGSMIENTDSARASYADGLRISVALSVGFAIVLGVLRIIKGWPLPYLIIGGYIGVVIMTVFAPQDIIGIAYDSGGVTTSTITVPLVTALGVGLASSIKGRNPMIDGFGLIAFASLTPMIFVMGYGILGVSAESTQKLDGPVGVTLRSVIAMVEMNILSMLSPVTTVLDSSLGPALEWLKQLPGVIGGLFQTLFSTVSDVIPIALTIIGFQWLVLRKPIPNLKKIILGFVLVIFGLAFFLDGLEAALFPLGRLMAEQLTHPEFIMATGGSLEDASWYQYKWVYLFAFAIGFATTLAEPSLLAVAIKANQVSAGAISIRGLRIAVAIGAATGIALGSYRIISGLPLYYFIISGYIVVVILTLYAPRMIIALAYDSGGVTTSTVTVPLVAALGLGLASNVPGRSPILDGFGLIAFTCLFPIMSVMVYAQISEWKTKRAHKQPTS